MEQVMDYIITIVIVASCVGWICYDTGYDTARKEACAERDMIYHAKKCVKIVGENNAP